MLMTVLVVHPCGMLLLVVMRIVLMFSLSMEPILATKSDAFLQYTLVSHITTIMAFCYSWKGESPLDIAKKNGHTTIVSMMTEILECELKESSPGDSFC